MGRKDDEKIKIILLVVVTLILTAYGKEKVKENTEVEILEEVVKVRLQRYN